MAQQTQQAPSNLLQINQWVERKYGHDGWWTAIQVDHAVMMFGSKVEALLSEYDNKGKQKYKLESLLHKPSEPIAAKPVTQLSRNSGIISPKPKSRKRANETIAS